MDNKLKLLRSIIPLILNVSHYMTDIIYLLYYFERIDIESVDKDYRVQLTKKIVILREQFRELLNKGSTIEATNSEEITINNNKEKEKEDDEEKKKNETYWKDEMDEIIKFQKMLNDQDLLSLLHDIIGDVMNKYITNRNSEIKLKNQINNCEIGLHNIINFLNDIIDTNNNNIIYDDNINRILNEELINSWRIELDLFNCLIFDIFTHDAKIIELFNKRHKCDVTERDLSKSDTFIKFITWLKDEEVFDGTLHL